MNAKLSKLILTPVLAVALLAMCNTALAQGTATGPFTSHIVTPGPEVLIGDPANPMPIDLDPTGAPWTKSIIDPNGLITAGGGLLDIVETIQNVGTEPWLDWHEHIEPALPGITTSIWLSVNLSINGNPIGFNALGVGTPDLWLDTFSQPVLPGDILVVQKVADVPGFGTVIPAGPFLRISEYPTPEPVSAALLGLGSLLVLGRRSQLYH